MKKFILFLFLLIYSPLFSQDYESYEILDRDSMSEILNYEGDKTLIKKVIIEDSIKGTNYNEGSEWREFRVLDTTFPNIEAVEIHTDQDIPDAHMIGKEYGLGLFTLFNNEFDENGAIYHGANWLKYFTALNTMKVGYQNFYRCEQLKAVNFQNTEIIEAAVFCWCKSLVEVNFPKARSVGNGVFHKSDGLDIANFPLLEKADWGVFIGCNNLREVSFGTGFTEETEIKFGHAVFGDSIKFTSGLYDAPVNTSKIKLTLGEFVVPKADVNFNTWQGTNKGYDDYPYIWKSVNVVGIENETDDTHIIFLGNNCYYIKNDYIRDLDLYDLLGRKIKTIDDTRIIDLNNLTSGVYFLKYTLDNQTKTEKIIRN